MRTKKVKLFMLCLIFSGFFMEISAQNHLDALIKKCETIESVDMEVVKTKSETGKGVETKNVNIRITNNKKLVDEFLDAFNKDSQNAERTMFNRRKNGEISYFQCQFLKHVYTISVRENKNANVKVWNNTRYQEQDRQKRQKERVQQQQERMKLQQEWRVKQQKERIKLQQERIKQQKERIKQQQERTKKRQQEQMNQQQYKIKELNSILLKHNIIADSLILKSSARLNSINWDSIAKKFGKDIDSVANKLNLGWDEILEKYEFE